MKFNKLTADIKIPEGTYIHNSIRSMYIRVACNVRRTDGKDVCVKPVTFSGNKAGATAPAMSYKNPIILKRLSLGTDHSFLLRNGNVYATHVLTRQEEW